MLCFLYCAAQTLIGFFQAVEAGQLWPVQLASVFVTSLAKKPTAQMVDEFRPVVVAGGRVRRLVFLRVFFMIYLSP